MTPTQTTPNLWIGREQIQGEDPSPGLGKIRFNGIQVQTHPHLTKQGVFPHTLERLRELGWFSLGHLIPVPEGATRKMERDYGQGPGMTGQRGMA